MGQLVMTMEMLDIRGEMQRQRSLPFFFSLWAVSLPRRTLWEREGQVAGCGIQL